MTGEDFERSPAAGLLADFARRKLLRLHESARETLALCEGENGPLHYAAACGTDVRLTADLAAAAAEGYTALHDALHGVTFAALGRKKKTDLFDEDIADRVKARRDALKKGRRRTANRFRADDGGSGGGYPHDGRAAGRAGRIGKDV